MTALASVEPTSTPAPGQSTWSATTGFIVLRHSRDGGVYRPQSIRFFVKVAHLGSFAKVRTFIDHLIAHFADASNLLPCAGAAQNCERLLAPAY